ncbi:MAG: MarR family transcriptional regulator [Alphaproteobacteria bacterium]|nr:MarR family transcriptional regulator [Alphaproteobacteria bacterium]
MSKNQPKSSPSVDNGAAGLVLEQFLPYRLSIVAQTVSGALSKLYASRFDLSVPQWRVMAVLGRYEPISANEVCDRVVMDKVAQTLSPEERVTLDSLLQRLLKGA